MNIQQIMNSLGTTLPIMGLGMLGIFAVTAIIILSMYALNFFTAKKNDKKDEQ